MDKKRERERDYLCMCLHMPIYIYNVTRLLSGEELYMRMHAYVSICFHHASVSTLLHQYASYICMHPYVPICICMLPSRMHMHP